MNTVCSKYKPTKKSAGPRRLLLVCGTLVSFAFLHVAGAFDWVPKSTEELHSDLLAHLEKSAKATADGRLKAGIRGLMEKIASPDETDWIEATHEFVRKYLDIYPPDQRNYAQREVILKLLDYPLHVNNFDPKISERDLDAFNAATRKYIDFARKRLLDQLDAFKDHDEGIIWKAYNMGFIVRNSGVTVGLDITSNPSIQSFRPGCPRPAEVEIYRAWPEKDIARLVRHLDILLITHLHQDHYCRKIVRAMLDAGKHVVMPAEIMTFNPASKGGVPALEKHEKMIILDSSVEIPMELGGIRFQAFRGNQGEKTPCNVYIIDIKGLRVAHNGDNYDREQDAKLALFEPVNVIIASSWNDIINLTRQARSAKGSDAAFQVLFPAHENELNHGVNHRESYMELFTREDRLGNKNFDFGNVVVLECGEAVLYPSLKPLQEH